MSSSSTTPSDTIMISDSPVDETQANGVAANGQSPTNNDSQLNGGNSSIPKPKRLACMICRKRKLKCDGLKPSCSTCSRLGHICAYDEVRRKSGPKRGYVKALEERLKQVETLLKTQDGPAPSGPSPDRERINLNVESAPRPSQPSMATAAANLNVADPSIGIASSRDMDRWQFNGESPNAGVDDFNFNSGMPNNSIPLNLGNTDNNFTWEMIGLGLEEPLPPQETIDELHQTYFEKVHPSLPMIHKYRYLTAMNLAPNQRPPVCLRYAMWTLASSVTDKYANLKDLFYQRARKYVELDYIKGYGEHLISIAHAQTHVLLSSYEFKMMYFPRAWISTGSAVRLCQMVGLHRLDGSGLDVKQCLPPPRDWTEREERRRTFWMAFCEDRYASIGTGWPMIIDEKDIMTNLPASDESFDMSKPEQTPSLLESMTPSGAAKISSFGGIVLMACLFGRNLIHLHRPDVDDRDHDLNGEFWKRHRNMDNILLNTSLCLPSSLKLPNSLSSANVVFTNMCIHTSTICLHQAAIFKADKNRLPASVSSESKVRCITAANEIASIMRMISHLDLATMNPFISFCLYVGARVFIQYLKSRPDDSQTGDSLRFLLAAMNALKRRNPLTESFLVQLDVDLEALIMRIPKLRSAFPRSSDNESSQLRATQGNLGGGGSSAQGVTYRNECHFMKTMGDDGNAVQAPDIIETDTAPDPAPTQTWPSSDNMTRLPTRERAIGTSARGGSYVPMHGLMPHDMSIPGYNPRGDVDAGSSSNDMGSTSPDTGGQSNRPTPNSSAASEHPHYQPSQKNYGNGGGGAGAGGGGGSGNSFETSPASSHHTNPHMGSGVAADNPTAAAAAFFDDPSGTFSLPTGLTPDNRYMTGGSGSRGGGGGMGTEHFGVSAGWHDLSGAGADMSPVSEGVLRSIMAMEPMEAMDLGWDPNP